MASIDDVKKGLRSLLMVSGGLTLSQIMRDFKQLMGQSINYKKFGYEHPFDFLRSLTDVLRKTGVCEKTRNPLYGLVHNENANHTKKLVDNQNNLTNKTYNDYRKPLNNKNNFGRRDYYQLQPFQKNKTIYNSQPQQKEEENAEEPEIRSSALKEPELHPQTIEKLKKLFTIYHKGIRKTRIPEVFKNTFKVHLEVDVNDVLKKMTELLTYEEDGVTYVCHNEFFLKNVRPKPLQESQTCTEFTTEERNRPTSQKSKHSSQSSSRNESPADRIHRQLKLSFFEILDKHPNGIFAMEFIKEFEEKKKYPLEPTEYGFNSLPDMINSLTSIFTIGPIRKSDGDYMLLDARKPKDFNGDTRKNSSAQYKNMSGLLFNLFKLFNQLNPIALNNVEEFYLKIFNEPIAWINFGWGSLEQLFVDMDQFFEIIEDQEKNEKYISRKLDMDQESRCPSTSIDHLMNASTSAPPDTYSLFEYVIQKAPLDQGPKLFQPVYVSGVISPHSFHIQFAFYEETFNTLKNVIEETYSDPNVAAIYKIPAQDLRLNMLCVAHFPGQGWLRASVLDFTPDNPYQVMVIFIDYGTTATIYCNELCYIKKDLMLLPAQALKCKLINCIPFGSVEWATYSTLFFIDLIHGIKLFAQFLKYKDGSHHINLCDENGNKDSFILSKMIKWCMARYVDEDEEEMTTKSGEEEVLDMPNGLGQELLSSERHLNPPQTCCSQPKLVKRILLTKGYNPFHLILQEDKLYMSEKEVSSIFKKKGRFAKLLESSDLCVSSIIVAEEENPILFQQMRICKIIEAFHGTPVFLYPIKNVLTIMIEMGHPHVREIIITLLKEEESFDSVSKWGEFNPNFINDVAVFERLTQFTNELTHIELDIDLKYFMAEKKRALARGMNSIPLIYILNQMIADYSKRKNELETVCEVSSHTT